MVWSGMERRKRGWVMGCDRVLLSEVIGFGIRKGSEKLGELYIRRGLDREIFEG